MREVLRRAQRASAVFFGNTGGALDQLQKGLACFVELIDLVACRVFGPPRKLYDTRLVTATIRLTMHLASSPRGPRRKIAPVKVELWRSVSVGRSSSAQLVFLFEPVADRQQRERAVKRRIRRAVSVRRSSAATSLRVSYANSTEQWRNATTKKAISNR